MLKLSKRTVRRIGQALAVVWLLGGNSGAGAAKAASDAPGAGPTSKIVLGYFASWKRKTFDHTRIRYDLLTHIVHAFTKPDSEGNLIIDDSYVYPELIDAAHTRGVRILMGIGGWGRSEGFPGMAASRTNRRRFIDQVIEFCRDQGYDGVDLDWEFVANVREKAAFVDLAGELAAALKTERPPLLLTMAAPSNHFWGRWIDYEAVAGFFDFVGIMSYDYHGEWSKRSGHNAPLYTCDGDEFGSVEESFRYTQRRGIPAGKILLGLAFFGHGFDTEELGMEFEECRNYTYREVVGLMDRGWTYIWDDCAKVPYLKNPGGAAIVSFDDTRSMILKCDFIEAVGAAGVIIWELGNDSEKEHLSLLSVVARELKR